jgi:hypothetical protein
VLGEGGRYQGKIADVQAAPGGNVAVKVKLDQALPAAFTNRPVFITFRLH